MLYKQYREKPKLTLFPKFFEIELKVQPYFASFPSQNV